MNKNIQKLFLKDSELSKPSVVLVVGWMVILIWFFITDFPFMREWPLLDIFAIPMLALLCGYYFGKYNLKELTSATSDLWKKYQRNR